MPFSYTCNDHSDFSADVLEDVVNHLAADHAATSRNDAYTTSINKFFVTQCVAQGHVPLRIFACSRCARRVEVTYDVEVTLCDECKREAA